MPREAGELTGLRRRIYDVLAAHREGITITELRQQLGLEQDEQQHLDRRVRSLDARYVIERDQRNGKTYYILRGERLEPLDETRVDQATRARIIHLSGQRCQMCGRTVAEDHIRLHIDHKIPVNWGGATEDENLWALCAECNEGKRNFFSSITDPRVQQAMHHQSVHVRIGELLKAFNGSPVPKEYIHLVARTHDDWEKRMRELRELGWQYHFVRQQEGNRVKVCFILDRWLPWPDDPARAIREAEAIRRTSRTQA